MATTYQKTETRTIVLEDDDVDMHFQVTRPMGRPTAEAPARQLIVTVRADSAAGNWPISEFGLTAAERTGLVAVLKKLRDAGLTKLGVTPV